MSREERNAALAAERIKQAQEVLRLMKDESVPMEQACARAGIAPTNYGNWRARAIAALKPVKRKPRKVTKTNRPTLHAIAVPNTPVMTRLIAFVGTPDEVMQAVRAL